MIPKYKAILFDMDGVIVDSMPYHYDSWLQIFQSLGIHVDKPEIYQREGEQGLVTISEILGANGKDLSLADMERLLREKEILFKKMASPRLFSGIEALIRDLKKKGYSLGMVTGTSRGEIDSVLPAHLIQTFDVIVTGDSLERGKPSPDPYLKAMAVLRIKPSEAMVIENAPYGIRSAKSAGIYCVAITTSLPKSYLKEADLVCDSLEEVRSLIPGHGLDFEVSE